MLKNLIKSNSSIQLIPSYPHNSMQKYNGQNFQDTEC